MPVTSQGEGAHEKIVWNAVRVGQLVEGEAVD
jgi:hypothetical protein